MRTVSIGLAIACCSTLAGAQVPRSTRPIQLVVSGGFQVPTGGFGDVHDLGVHADASLIITALGGLRLRPELSYARFKVKETLDQRSTLRGSLQGSAGGAARDVYSDALSSIIGGFANLEIPLGPAGFQPFVLAGVGAVNLTSDVNSVAEALRDTKMSLNIGAGLRFRLGGIGGIIEARLNNVPAGGDTRTYFKDVRTIPVSFGLVF
ncbi:MAG: hypothetical protein ACT4P7_07490 [Gemmatimonadaceae bacterium]